jgi:hypothetical protein
MELDDLKRNLCRICGNFDDNKIYTAREMMFGFRDEFDYIECSKCGCVQIVEIPKNINKYYPPNYYSYQFKSQKFSLYKRLGLLRKKMNGQLTNNINFPLSYLKGRVTPLDNYY